MKTKLALFGGILVFAISPVLAQSNITNDYVIVSTGTVTETTPYVDALDNANWEPYRLQNQRTTFSFANGFQIELKSAIEMANLGYPLNVPTYAVSLPNDYVPPTLTLLAGNVVGMSFDSPPTKVPE